jgi:hypothetical protein
MKFRPLALALLLLCACTPAEDMNDAAANGSSADVPLQNGAQAPQPTDGQAATAPSGEIAFSVSPDSVAPGGTLTLTLANRTGERLGYNLCTSAIETAAGATVPSDRVCTMELRTLEPGDSGNYSFELPQELAPGSYRLTTSVQRMDAGTQSPVRTEVFEVTGG